jgi:hypothetical protein
MSNNQNKSYLVLPGGKECKPVNPFDKDKFRIAYVDFEANNPVLTITEVMPEGETFSGVEVTQICHTTGWSDLMPSEIELYVNSNATTRIAIKPLKAKEPERTYCGLSKADAIELVSGYNPAINIPKYTKPSVDVVENKETVEGNFKKFTLYDENTPAVATDHTTPITGLGEKEQTLVGIKSPEDILKEVILSYMNIQITDGKPDYYMSFWMLFDPSPAKYIIIKAIENYHASKIEGIVGFVLEWVSKHPIKRLEEAKFDIIKEYNNGK